MILLISTSKSLIAWDDAGQEYHRVHHGSGVYYGISFSANRIFAAARRLPVDSSEIEMAQSSGVILVFDPELNQVEELVPPFALRDVHQIFFDGRRLFITSPFDDMIAVWEAPEWRQWRPLPPRPRRSRTSGGRHFNSLVRYADEIYLLAHNFGPSEVFVFDAETLDLRRSFAFGSHAHNLWFESGALWTCSSREHRIISDRGGVVHTGDFPRGVVATHSGDYIGVSVFSEHRQRRADYGACIARFSPLWGPAESYRISGEGMIHEIRCPGVPDAAHPETVGPALDLTALRRRSSGICITRCALLAREPAAAL